MNSIADNCRSILRKRQQGYLIPSNPIYSLYGLDNIQVPVTGCEEPSYCNTLSGLSLTKPPSTYLRHAPCIDRNIRSMQSKLINQARYPSIPSENCVQFITNSITTKIRYKIPEQEIALLCCCLPSLIRQIMSKSPWLTANDIIQWLSAEIMKESMNGFDQSNSKQRNTFSNSRQRSPFNQDSFQQQQQDNGSNESEDDFVEPQDDVEEDNYDDENDNDNDSLLSYESGKSRNSQRRRSPSNYSSRSALDVPGSGGGGGGGNRKRNRQKSRSNRSTSSTRSFNSQRSKNRDLSDQDSLASPSLSTDNRSIRSRRKPSKSSRSLNDQDTRSIRSDNQADNFEPNEDFDGHSPSLASKQRSRTRSTHRGFDYPGPIDGQAADEVKKCLAFYEQMREHFDDNVAAMLLKCCLCYGGCSGKK